MADEKSLELQRRQLERAIRQAEKLQEKTTDTTKYDELQKIIDDSNNKLDALYERQLKYSTKNIEMLEKEYDFLTKKLGLAQNNKQVVELEIELQEKRIEKNRKALDEEKRSLQERNDISEDEARRQTEILKQKEQQIDKEEKINELLKERLKATKELGANAYKDLSELGLGLNNLADSTFGSMLANLAFLNGSIDKLRGKLGSIGDSFKQIGLSFREGVGKGLENVFDAISPLTDRILGRLASEMNKAFIQNIKELMEMGPAFVERTGQSVKTFNQNIKDGFGFGSTELTKFGVGLKELGESFTILNESSSYFVQSSKQTQNIYQETALISKKLGISYDSTAKSLDNMTRGFLISGKQASENFKLIQREALGSAISVGKMGKDFESVFPKLVAQGKQAVSIFIDLAKAANKLGLETSTLLSISEGYDTFEGAAEKAGALNAVLGGDYLNSLEMMNATESERILIMKRSFDASGMQFNSLDKYTKKAVAASLGISDLNEAERLLSSSTAELTVDMMKSAASEEERTKRAEEATKVSEKFSAAMQSLVIATAPIVETFSDIVTGLAEFNDSMGGTLTYIAVALLSIPLLIKSIRGVRGAITEVQSAGGVKDYIKNLVNPVATPPTGPTPPAGGPTPARGGGISGFFTSMKDVFIGYGKAGSEILKGAGTIALAMSILSAPLLLIAGVIKIFGLDMTPLLELGAALVMFSGSLLILSKISSGISFVDIAMLSAGLVILSFGIASIGTALQTFVSVDFKTAMLGITTIGILTSAVFGLGAIFASGIGAAAFAFGLAGIIGLGLALNVLGNGLSKIGPNLSNFQAFLSLNYSNLASINKSSLEALGDLVSKFEDLEDVNPEVVVGVTKVFKEVDNLKTITKDQQEAITSVLNSATQFAVTVNNKTDNAMLTVLEKMTNAILGVGTKTVINTVANNNSQTRNVLS